MSPGSHTHRSEFDDLGTVGHSPCRVSHDFEHATIFELDVHGSDQTGRIRGIAAVLGQDADEICARLEELRDIELEDIVEITACADAVPIDEQFEGIVGSDERLSGLDLRFGRENPFDDEKTVCRLVRFEPDYPYPPKSIWRSSMDLQGIRGHPLPRPAARRHDLCHECAR